MIVKEYIKKFEKLGMGMFVHFGLYSVLGEGEWTYCLNKVPTDKYESLTKEFNPEADWAKKLVEVAVEGGCKYVTLTTRHHDGFSLYDAQGLNDYDAPHALAGRDLVKEFVDACNDAGVIPFFYHTLLDWRHPDYKADFPKYLVYLRASVELLCKNYGKIGGIWFDGMWDKPDADWEEDAMYSMIRSHQPDAMIINNTGLSHRGELGHIELDSVTFERGKPSPINLEDSPKYIASEMCQVLCCHWGYAEHDYKYTSLTELIRELAVCRRYGSNYLLNVGPMGNGYIHKLDKAMISTLGDWVSLHKEALYTARPTGIDVKGKPNDFILADGNSYYVFSHYITTASEDNVVIPDKEPFDHLSEFTLDKKVKSVNRLNDGKVLDFTQYGDAVSISVPAYRYGEHLVVEIIKVETE